MTDSTRPIKLIRQAVRTTANDGNNKMANRFQGHGARLNRPGSFKALAKSNTGALTNSERKSLNHKRAVGPVIGTAAAGASGAALTANVGGLALRNMGQKKTFDTAANDYKWTNRAKASSRGMKAARIGSKLQAKALPISLAAGGIGALSAMNGIQTAKLWNKKDKVYANVNKSTKKERLSNIQLAGGFTSSMAASAGLGIAAGNAASVPMYRRSAKKDLSASVSRPGIRTAEKIALQNSSMQNKIRAGIKGRKALKWAVPSAAVYAGGSYLMDRSSKNYKSVNKAFSSPVAIPKRRNTSADVAGGGAATWAAGKGVQRMGARRAQVSAFKIADTPARSASRNADIATEFTQLNRAKKLAGRGKKLARLGGAGAAIGVGGLIYNGINKSYDPERSYRSSNRKKSSAFNIAGGVGVGSAGALGGMAAHQGAQSSKYRKTSNSLTADAKASMASGQRWATESTRPKPKLTHTPLNSSFKKDPVKYATEIKRHGKKVRAAQAQNTATHAASTKAAASSADSAFRRAKVATSSAASFADLSGSTRTKAIKLGLGAVGAAGAGAAALAGGKHYSNKASSGKVFRRRQWEGSPMYVSKAMGVNAVQNYVASIAQEELDRRGTISRFQSPSRKGLTDPSFRKGAQLTIEVLGKLGLLAGGAMLNRTGADELRPGIKKSAFSRD